MRRALFATLLVLLAASTRADAQQTISVIGADLVIQSSLIAPPAPGPLPYIQAGQADLLTAYLLAPPPAELRLALAAAPFKMSIPLIKR